MGERGPRDDAALEATGENNPERRAYRELQRAKEEERLIRQEMERILTNAPTREEGERRVLEMCAERHLEAVKETTRLLKEWLATF